MRTFGIVSCFFAAIGAACFCRPDGKLSAQEPVTNSETSSEPNRLEPLVDLLLEIPDPSVRVDVLKGMHQAIKGQRDLPMPTKWPQARKQLAESPSREVRQLARSLSLIFGDPQAMQSLRELIANDQAPLADRKAAIGDLAQVRDKKLLPMLKKHITDRELSDAALRGLAAYNAPETPALILKHYAQFTPEERQSALFTLVSRASYAQALLEAVEHKHVPARDLSTYLVRQIAAFDKEDLNAKLRKVWGEFRPTSADKARKIAAIKSKLTPNALAKADRALGRAVFEKTCAGCHQLFDAGRPVGPNLTGAAEQRGLHSGERLGSECGRRSGFSVDDHRHRGRPGAHRHRHGSNRRVADPQNAQGRCASRDRRHRSPEAIASLDDARRPVRETQRRGDPQSHRLPRLPRPSPAAGSTTEAAVG